LFTPQDSTWSRDNYIIENLAFMKEAESIDRLARIYAVKSKIG
jgi:hypothetical protein